MAQHQQMNTPPTGVNVADQFQAQIVALQDVVKQLQQRLGEAEGEIRGNGGRGVGARAGGGYREVDDLVSRKFFDPEPFTSKASRESRRTRSSRESR